MLDLRELKFMDSSGLHAIISAHRQARDGGGRLVILQGSGAVRRLFEVTGMHGYLEIAAAAGDE